jgi:hypothetical protein
MGLFKPKWVRESEAKDRAAAKAQRAVERLTDPNDLIRVALESPWGTAQLSAVTRLDDDAALLAVLNASTEWYVHEAIVGKLRRQDALIHYMFYGKYSDARKIALSRVEDQQALRRFILEYPNDPAAAPMKEAAMQRVTDDDILLDLARREKELGSELRRLAVKRISGEPAARQLYAGIQSGQHKIDPADLLEGLGAPEFLLELALSETTAPLTRALAVEQLGKLGSKEYATQLAALKGSPLQLGRYPYTTSPSMTLGELARDVCVRLSGKSVFELAAETEDEAFLNRQIGLLLKKCDTYDRVPYEAMNYIRAFYRAGRFRNRIAELDGRVVSLHTDRPSEHCVDEHVDSSEIVFRL